MAISSNDRQVRYFDLASFELINSSSPDAHPIHQVAFDPEGKHVFAAHSDSLKIWDLEAPRLIQSVLKPSRLVCDIKVDSEYAYVLESA